jgi:hypothetical protein
MERQQSPGLSPDVLLSVPCYLVLLVWGVYTLLKPSAPRGEELVAVYWWVVPLIMAIPAWVAIHSWLDRWALNKTQLFLRNGPFALTVLLWLWIASLPA